MALDTLTPPYAPSTDSSRDIKMKVLRANFSTYVQRTPDGLNSVKRMPQLSWHALTSSQLSDLETFFTTKKGATAFLYTLPDESVQRKWITVEDSLKITYPDGVLATLSVAFEEVFDV